MPIPGEPFLELNDLLQAQGVPLDLNAPLPEDDDLGMLDEHPDLIPIDVIANVNGEAQEEDVIDASSDSAYEDVALPAIYLNEPVHEDLMDHYSPKEMQVDVNVPQADNHVDQPQNDQPLNEEDGIPGEQQEDGIPGEEHIVGDNDLQLNAEILDEQDNMNAQNILQLGFVELREPSADPVFASLLNASYTNDSQIQPSPPLPPDFYRFWAQHFAPSVHIPPDWAAFFTAATMNSGTFD